MTRIRRPAQPINQRPARAGTLLVRKRRQGIAHQPDVQYGLPRSTWRPACSGTHRPNSLVPDWLGPVLNHFVRQPGYWPLGALLITVLTAGVLWAVPGVIPGFEPGDSVPAAQHPVPSPRAVRPHQELQATDDPLQLLATYNATSITAGLAGDAAALQPFFAAGSSAWVDVQAEYRRRAHHGETHAATLVRWGILQQHLTATSAQIETQEQWDDATYRQGALVDTQRGIVLRLRYHLSRERVDAPWRITTIDTTSVVR